MNFILDSENVLAYLARHQLANFDRQTTSLTRLNAKNFNILVSSPDRQPLLVKQGTSDANGQQSDELFTEWQLQQLIDRHSTLSELRDFMPRTLYVDRENSIVVNHFWETYDDLQAYYDDRQEYDPDIAIEIGHKIGLVHRLTYDRSWQELLETTLGQPRNPAQRVVQHLHNLHSGIFGVVPIECCQFYKLYQQYPSLAAAVDRLAQNHQACCLAHNDLKLNNLLIHHLETPPTSRIRTIDWERARWGDPAADLGNLINSYLQLWLENLVVSNELSLQESLQLAIVPLSSLQPVLLALVQSYRQTFPAIFVDRPDYLSQVLQHAGLSLIRRIEVIIETDLTFDNRGIAMLQVAKQLLCNPMA
ncbi:phosphotransferase, partial [Chamaesiphon sp. VAR_69_metabat_338]|uniref:phosphotransferase n=1 Tax=Chamaesiphon sp. VAR_69_metabat_338 TaxID=2964704 RepID=UPI00286E6328